MASLYCGESVVEYSARDGSIRSLSLDGTLLYDQVTDIAIAGWIAVCWNWILMNKGFHCYEGDHVWSKPMFVEWVEDQMTATAGR